MFVLRYCILNILLVLINSEGISSRLDFNADSTLVSADDVEGQSRLRSSRYWGRLYIDGWPQTIQYFRAHFGGDPPLGRQKFVFADPPDACHDLINTNIISTDTIILAHRGNCSFGNKAKIVSKTAASGIVIINNEEGIEHLSAPDAMDVNISVTSISQIEGNLLQSVMMSSTLEGYMVPVLCKNTGTICEPTTEIEKGYIQHLSDGGYVHINTNSKDDLKLEYLLAKFGVSVSTQSVSLMSAEPADACSPITNNITNQAVLVVRGGCDFLTKSTHIQQAGGQMMILGNLYPNIIRMSVEPRYKGLSIHIPIVMVSQRTYTHLLALTPSSSSPSTTGPIAVTFTPHSEVNNTIWNKFEQIYNRGITTFDPSLYSNHLTWPDRKLTIEDIINQFFPQFKTDSADSNKSEL